MPIFIKIDIYSRHVLSSQEVGELMKMMWYRKPKTRDELAMSGIALQILVSLKLVVIPPVPRFKLIHRICDRQDLFQNKSILGEFHNII